MSHSLPLHGSRARSLFEIEDLVAIATGQRQPATLQVAMLQARRLCADNPAVKSAAFIVLRANDELQLISIGRRGGVRLEHSFGKVN